MKEERLINMFLEGQNDLKDMSIRSNVPLVDTIYLYNKYNEFKIYIKNMNVYNLFSCFRNILKINFKRDVIPSYITVNYKGELNNWITFLIDYVLEKYKLPYFVDKKQKKEFILKYRSFR